MFIKSKGSFVSANLVVGSDQLQIHCPALSLDDDLVWDVS